MTKGKRSTAAPWWARELLNLSEPLHRWIGRRVPAEAADLVSAVNIEVTKVVSGPDYPSSWQGEVDPGETDVALFRSLVWRIARARTFDQLRRSYVRRLWADQQTGSASPPSDSSEETLDARSFLTLLSRAIDQLSQEDRELLLGAAGLAGSEDPLTGAERVRLHRLRRQLAKDVADAMRPNRSGGGR